MTIISMFESNKLCLHLHLSRDFVWDRYFQPYELAYCFTHTHKHTEPFNGPLSGTTRVGRYEKKHSPTHTHPDHQTSFINFLHLLRSIASSVFSLSAWQSSLTTSLQVLFRLPLGLGPSTSYSMHFFTQSSSFRYTCPYTAACSARFCSCLLFQYN